MRHYMPTSTILYISCLFTLPSIVVVVNGQSNSFTSFASSILSRLRQSNTLVLDIPGLGQIKGSASPLQRDVTSFRGIPFAEAPIEDLRYVCNYITKTCTMISPRIFLKHG